MNQFWVLSTIFMLQTAANVDIFNKCPDFRPLNVSDIKKLDGHWFTRQMITHYEGKQALLDPGLCVTVNVNSYRNSTPPDLRVSAVLLTIRTYDEYLEEYNITNEIKFTLKVDANKTGLWTENEHRSVQVIMLDDDFLVITLCSKTRLISFAMARENSTNVALALEMAHEKLGRRGLSVEKTVTLCEVSKGSRPTVNILIRFLFALIFILSLVLNSKSDIEETSKIK